MATNGLTRSCFDLSAHCDELLVRLGRTRAGVMGSVNMKPDAVLAAYDADVVTLLAVGMMGDASGAHLQKMKWG